MILDVLSMCLDSSCENLAMEISSGVVSSHFLGSLRSVKTDRDCSKWSAASLNFP